MTLTVGTAVEADDYEITVLGTSSAGSTKKLTLTAEVESTDLELSTLTLIAKPKQVLLGQGLEVLGQLVILSESAEVKPEGLTISLSFISPSGQQPKFEASTDAEGNYQLAVPFKAEEVGECLEIRGCGDV